LQDPEVARQSPLPAASVLPRWGEAGSSASGRESYRPAHGVPREVPGRGDGGYPDQIGIGVGCLQIQAGGSTLSIGNRRSLGLVDVASPAGSCSGILVAPSMVLTATHCLDLAAPANNTFSAPRTNGVLDIRAGGVVSVWARPTSVSSLCKHRMSCSSGRASRGRWSAVQRSRPSSTSPPPATGEGLPGMRPLPG